VATLIGTAGEYFLDSFLSKALISRSELRVVNLQPGDMETTMRRGDVDAVSVWEPHAERIIRALGPEAVVFEDKELYIERFNIVTTEAVIRARTPALQHFLKAMANSSEWIGSNAENAFSIVAPRIGLEKDDLQGIWSRFAFPANLSGGLLLSLEKIEAWAATKDKRPERPADDLRRLIDPSLLHSAEPTHVLLGP
jgi:NitT/TauT family transport system substrate-binding protein